MLSSMFKISFRKMKRSYVLLFLTIVFCVAALAIALLMVRSKKLQEADWTLQHFGNYDIAFCDATPELAQNLESDKRFSELGHVYGLGEVSFVQSGNKIELGALQNQDTENMYYVNPVMGRYPTEKDEICVDKIALKCSGYEEKLGQRIAISYQDKQGALATKEYKLTGIIEIQKQQDGMTYCSRQYPQEMFSLSNMNEDNFPFAYVSAEEAEQVYGFQKNHILANVSPKEDADSVMVSFFGYKEDGSIDMSVTKGLHIPTNHALGREWTALCILGNQLNNDYSSISDGVRQSMESGEVSEDLYTKVFIPIFIVLIVFVSSIGIFDAVRLSVEEQREVYGILLGMGMTGKRIVRYVILEILLLLLSGILVGWGVALAGYQLILELVRQLLHLTLPSALAMDAYYAPFVKMVTRNPWLCSACVACAVAVVAILGVAVDLLRMSPLRLERSAIRKKRRGKHLGSVYHVLNRYMGKDSRWNGWIPCFMVCVIMAVSVFGFLHFRKLAAFETAEQSERLESTKINGMDYYMQQSNSLYDGAAQYMHGSGVTEEMFKELASNAAVKTVRGVIVNHSSALILDKEANMCNVLRPQSEYYEAISTDVEEQVKAKLSLKKFAKLGVDTDKKEVFHVPTVGIREEDISRFDDCVLEGEIHPDKLLSGEEALVVLTDESYASYFTVGETLPLYDFVRPEELDNSPENLMGQLPEKYKRKDKAYSVSADGETYTDWCNDTLKACPVRIGAVIYIDVSEDAFYYDGAESGYAVNLMTGAGAFQAWGLMNQNYTRVGVGLKERSALAGFEGTWLQMVQQAGYMDSTDAYSVLQDKEKRTRQIMAIFYAVFAVLLIIGVLCAGNSIAMRIQRMEAQQKLLHCLGMTRRKILLLYMRRYALYGIIGTVFSVIPVTVFSLLRRYASRLMHEAYLADTTELLEAEKPWVSVISDGYDMLDGMFAVSVFVAGAIAVILLSLLVLTQSARLKKLLEE